MGKLLIAVLCVFVALPANAGIKEKKAIRKMTAQLETGIAAMKKTCGNSAIEMKVDVDKKFTPHNISLGTSAVEQFFKAMEEVCQDADYKEEIANINAMSFTLSDATEVSGTNTKYYGEIKLEGTTMHVAFPVKKAMGRGSSDTIPKAIQELY